MQTNQEFDIQTHSLICQQLRISPSSLVCHCAWVCLHAQWHSKNMVDKSLHSEEGKCRSSSGLRTVS